MLNHPVCSQWQRLAAGCRVVPLAFFLGLFLCLIVPTAKGDLPEIVDKVRPSIVVVGTFQLKRSPQFVMRGTGFVVGDGRHVATNAHVVSQPVDIVADEKWLVLVRTGVSGAQPRAVEIRSIDQAHDLALLRIDGAALPTLSVSQSDAVREGQSVAFVGFPLGGLLGFFSPVTHAGIISSITPIALPASNAHTLDVRTVTQIRRGVFDIYQLDATAYPGNSGGPLYELERGEVVGVINMVMVKETKESAMSRPSAISYAIPVKYLRDLLAKFAL